jgi:hypothetical protein
MKQSYMIVLGLLALTAVSAGLLINKNLVEEDTFNQRNLINKGIDNTTLWLYYDQSDVNSRWWADFGARSSRVLNTPYLNLCYQSIVTKNGKTYNVKVLAGLSDVAILLGGWNQLPKALQNPIAPVGEAELNYIRATVLRRFGGLWVNPSIICVKSFPDFTKSENPIFTGTDKDESYADSNGTPAPGVDVMYSPKKDCEVFEFLENLALKRIERQEGGKQFRSDIKWDLRQAMEMYTCDYIPNLEFARKSNGRRIQLEDLLGVETINVPENTVYIPVDFNELQNRRNFGWFLRMSEDQILESDLYISMLLREFN